LEVERSLTAADVIDILAQVFLIRGVPKFIRSNNGPEFIAGAIRRYLATGDVGTLYIAPGSPWEDGFAESFFSRLRDERLNAGLFADLREAKTLAAQWQSEYNHRRPHSALNYQAPAAFPATCRSANAAYMRQEKLGALPPDPRPLPRRRAPAGVPRVG
jgi:transposase InsO family protein